MRGTDLISLSILLGFMGYLAGCSVLKPPGELIPSGKDSFNCDRPAQTVVLNKQELELAGAKILEFSLGQVDYKSRPELIEVMTKASTDLLVVDYLVCVAMRRGDIAPNDPVQVDYIKSFLSFLQSKPTSDQIITWREQYPFPKKEIKEKTRKIEVGKDARFRLRNEHQVKPWETQGPFSELSAISAIPSGVYSFTNFIPDGSGKFWFGPDPLIIRDYQALLEFHKLADGSLYVIGFVDANTADQIRNETRPENFWVTLYSDQWEKAQEIVAIPLAGIIFNKTPRGFEIGEASLAVWDMLLR